MDGAPAAQADPCAQQARRDEREQEVEGDCPQSQPDRSIRGEEGQDRVLQADRGIAVGNRRQHVRGDEGDREQWEVAMKAREEHTWPRAERAGHAEHEGGGQEQERDNAGAAREVTRASSGRWSRSRGLRLGSGPIANEDDGAIVTDEPRGEAAESEPGGCVGAEDDCCRARRIGVDAGRAGHGDGAPGRGCRATGARIDDVVAFAAAHLPAACGDPRSGETATAHRHNRPSGGERRIVVISDADRPAGCGHKSRDGDVAAE